VDYSTLLITIKGYVENDFPDITFTDKDGSSSSSAADFTSTEQVNTFIQQAEQRIYNSVQLPAARKNSTGAFTGNNKYLAAPSDFLAPFSLAVINSTTNASASQTYLLNKDVDFIREAFPNPTDTGVPAYYAMWDASTFIIGPTPDAAYKAEIHYYYYPESIVTATQTWVGDNFSDALLYGSLLEAYTFMKGEGDVLLLYKARYDEAIQQLKRLGDGLDRRDSYRSGQLRIPIT